MTASQKQLFIGSVVSLVERANCDISICMSVTVSICMSAKFMNCAKNEKLENYHNLRPFS